MLAKPQGRWNMRRGVWFNFWSYSCDASSLEFLEKLLICKQIFLWEIGVDGGEFGTPYSLITSVS